MKSLIKIILGVSCFVSFIFSGSSVLANNRYLIDIPSVPIQTSSFARHLNDICAGLSKSMPHIKKLSTTPATTYKSEVLAEWADSSRAANTASVEDMKLLGALDNINIVCQKLSIPASLTDSDLDTLRQVRKDSKRLSDIADALKGAAVERLDSIEKTLNEVKKKDITGVVQGGLLPGVSFESVESKLINGLAEFINTRAKAEAALYLKQQLSEELCEKTIKQNGIEIDLEKYFSNLCIALKSDETYISLNSIGIFLKNAAQRDLENLPEHVFTDLLLQSKNTQIKEALVTALLSYAVYNEEKKGRTTLDIFSGLADVTKLPCEQTEGEHCRSIKLVRLVSLITRSILEQEGYDEQGINLLYHSIGAILSFEDHIQKRDSQDFLLSQSFNQFSANQVSRFLAVFNMAINMIAEVDGGIKSLLEGEFDKDTQIEKRIYLVTKFLNSAEYIVNQLILAEDPAQAGHWIDLDGVKTVKGYIKVAQEMTGFGQALLKQDASDMAFALISVLSKIDAKYGGTGLAENIPGAVYKTLPLIIEIANANDSTQVANIIEAAAAPVGSYSHKFKRRMTTINSFFGITTGYEKYQTSDGDIKTKFSAAYVPVGIHVTFPKNQWNWGAFVSILDLGTYAVDRKEDEEITTNVGFDQILSPGVFLTYANKATGPLTVGAGVSMGNKLVTDTATDKIGNSYRAHVFIALDLTLFAF